MPDRGLRSALATPFPAGAQTCIGHRCHTKRISQGAAARTGLLPLFHGSRPEGWDPLFLMPTRQAFPAGRIHRGKPPRMKAVHEPDLVGREGPSSALALVPNHMGLSRSAPAPCLNHKRLLGASVGSDRSQSMGSCQLASCRILAANDPFQMNGLSFVLKSRPPKWATWAALMSFQCPVMFRRLRGKWVGLCGGRGRREMSV